MMSSSADPFGQKGDYLFFWLSPSPSFSKRFKGIPLDSKWHPDFAEVMVFVYLYGW